MIAHAVRVTRLGKKYRKGADVRGRLIEWLRRGGNWETFWALRNVTFNVHRGEMLGLVGPNGAGKSTLLRILSRITRPNEGAAEIVGRVGSLLEVGTGFHPEMTGRENVYLNGALIGMRKREIDRKFDEIVDFSGVEDFIDTPLKRYSSGMRVRLGFAVAVHLQQEILLVDEVLAVGDATFREKCLAKMSEVTSEGRTVIFVGHNLPMVSAACDRALWIDHGSVRALGPAEEVVRSYQDEATANGASESGFISLEDRPSHTESNIVVLTHVRLADGAGAQTPSLRTGAPARFAVGFRRPPDGGGKPGGITIALTLFAGGQNALAVCTNRATGDELDGLPAEGEVICAFERLALAPGTYRMALRVEIEGRLVQVVPNAGEFHVTEGAYYEGGTPPPSGSGGALLDYRWSVGAGRRDMLEGS